MILLREVRDTDLTALEQFAQIPGFINLPDDREILKEKIKNSAQSFAGKFKKKSDTKYIFVAEEMESQRVLGTSMIAGQHGTASSPHFYFEVSTEKKYSKTINTGFLHGCLELKLETDGPSEIGGLVVDPSVRNSPDRIGRQISFVRFLFAGLNRAAFKPKVLAELLPPLNKKGLSPLWEALGRRFTNMDYWEADRLCQKDKEFIFSLFPSERIYTTFFSAEARNAIGKVGKDTEPVYHMLTRIGFEYKNQVDPFDGGPHLWADLDKILPIQKIQSAAFEMEAGLADEGYEEGLIAKKDQVAGQFRAVAVDGMIHDGKFFLSSGTISRDVASALELHQGDPIVFMPYY